MYKGIVEDTAHVGNPASGAETADSETGPESEIAAESGTGAESAISVDAASSTGAEAASVVGSSTFQGPSHAPHATIGGTARA
jgi:hypothetical protein